MNKKADSDWETLCGRLINAMGESFSGNHNYGREDRTSRYRELAPWLGDFDESDWFKDAIDIEVRGLEDSENGLLSMFTM
jgi:hypothetical protein